MELDICGVVVQVVTGVVNVQSSILVAIIAMNNGAVTINIHLVQEILFQPCLTVPILYKLFVDLQNNYK